MEDIITSDRIQALDKMLKGAGKISVVTHTRPDGDAIGSSVALSSFIRDRYLKEARIVVADPFPQYLDFILDESDRKCFSVHGADKAGAEAWINDSDLIICLDCNGFDRTDTLQGMLRTSDAGKVLIDHHLNPEEQEFDICFSCCGISSCCELLYWVLKALPCIDGCTSRIPHHSLTAIMAGMTTDTNNFANSVYPSTLMMASQLLEAGVDREMILSELYNEYRENRLRMIGHALKDRMAIVDGVSYIILDSDELKEYDIEDGELEGLVNMPLGIGKVRMSLLLKEDNGYFRVSVRSKKGTSANDFATRFFNGGGHEQASGGRLYFPKDIPDSSGVEEYVVKAIKLISNKRDK